MKVTITTGSVEDFFARGKARAGKMDRGEYVEASHLITFEDPDDLVRTFTAGRIAVFRAIKEEPGSITDIARRLGRDRSAVKRDVDVLVEVGLIEVEEVPNGGHGRKKLVKAAVENFEVASRVGEIPRVKRLANDPISAEFVREPDSVEPYTGASAKEPSSSPPSPSDKKTKASQSSKHRS